MPWEWLHCAEREAKAAFWAKMEKKRAGLATGPTHEAECSR